MLPEDSYYMTSDRSLSLFRFILMMLYVEDVEEYKFKHFSLGLIVKESPNHSPVKDADHLHGLLSGLLKVSRYLLYYHGS